MQCLSVFIASVEEIRLKFNVPCDLTPNLSIEMITNPKEQRTEALNESIDTGGLGYRLNKLPRVISTSLSSL